jgi:hypothetical protein
MTVNASALRELEGWTQQGRAAAEARLPALLDLPPDAMSRELAEDPVLRAGVIRGSASRSRSCPTASTSSPPSWWSTGSWT